MIHLSPRLAMVAGCCRPGMPITDIGTDHAYVPAYLLLQGTIPSAVAADLRPGPLQNAGETVEKYGLSEKIALVLSDGFQNLTPGACNDYVLAGMGGNLIADLLAAAPWVKEPGTHFVLQPQSHQEDLRAYLYQNGFSILKEELAKEEKHLYICLEVEYTGKIIHSTPLENYLGEVIHTASPYKEEYFSSVCNRLQKRYRGLLCVEGAEEERQAIATLIENIQQEVNLCLQP